MSTRKFLIFMSLVLALLPLSWGVHQVGAVVVPTGAAGFNPAVNYNLPNFAYSPNIRKFVDALPGLGAVGCTRSNPFGTGTCNENDLGQYIPIAQPDTTTYADADYYAINAEQYQVKMHSDLPLTWVRGYMQSNATSPSVQNVKQYLGPAIIAKTFDYTREANTHGNGKPVRVLFKNNLPLETQTTPGILVPKHFIPVDTTYMGAGTGPNLTAELYTQNRATIPHLHGGATPWISDGTPHQWLVPAGQATAYPNGPSLQNVPDMPVPGAGMATLYWSNQQSGRLMFYHDHAYGMTRHNVYAGMAAPFLLIDQVEEDMITGSNVSRAFTAPNAVLPNLGGVYKYGIPLVIMDKTFVNDATTPPGPGFTGTPTNPTLTDDPLWATYVGTGGGNLWFPHEYMPNQDIYDPSGANPLGRWDYGPWLNPPAVPINATLPSPSGTPESFMDTMTVNGTAFPYVNVPASAVRFRILNACNDRTINLSLFVADPAGHAVNGFGTETKMVPAQPGLDPTWPVDGRNGGVPDPATKGPSWYQIGTEGGLLPQVAVIDPQPIVFEQSRLVPTVLGIANKSLLLLPAVRADVVVDFSGFAGKTLILYNDAPAAAPLFDERYDLYTGDPDMRSTGGAPTTMAGFGPNTRTVMQIRVAAAPVKPFNLAALQAALPQAYKASQAPPIVPQAAYNAAFGTANGDTFVNNTDSTINLTGVGQSVSKVITTLGGSGFTLPPTVNFITADGTGAGAVATAFLDGVTGVTVTTAGTGYNHVPTVIIDPPSTITPATFNPPTIVGGAITAITPLTGGTYTAGTTPSVVITDATGTGATATATLTGTAVTAITVTNGGTNYTAPTVRVLDVLNATAVASVTGSTVVAIVIADPGGNYTSLCAGATNPAVTIIASPLDTIGTAAAAISGITCGAAAHIQVTNGGAGYKKAPFVYLTGGGGTGATADALLVGDTVLGSKNITEGFDPWYGKLNVLLGTTPVPLDPFTPAPAVPGLAQYIDPPSDIWNDGQTYVFRLTHLGVDNHAVHFHLVNLQLVNRIDYTNTILAPDSNEVGWKETVRTEPFTDLVLAVKPKAMLLPFALPRNTRLMDPTTPQNSTKNYVQPAPVPGLPNPAGISNQPTDYGWEYVWHCHLLGHEENDMMRPIIFNPPGTFSAATTLNVAANFNNLLVSHVNGATITFTATAGGSADPSGSVNTSYKYRFWLSNAGPGITYTMVQDWSGNPTYSLPLYYAPGTYNIAVDVSTNLTTPAVDLSTKPGGTPGTPLTFTVTNGRDFGGDGQTDILWRNPGTGENVVWNMNGVNLTSFVYLNTLPGPWEIVGTGDFNNSGKPDILWRNPTTGENVVWYMDGTTNTSFAYLPSLPGPWEIVGTGDFNNSGKPDILWRNPTTGENVVWYMNGTNVIEFAYLPAVPPPWQIVGIGDFNGDGSPDILWRHPTSGENYVWFVNGVDFLSDVALPTIPANWQIAGVADFNGDGKPDILWRDPATGENVVWYMDGTNVTSFVYLTTQPGPWQAVER